MWSIVNRRFLAPTLLCLLILFDLGLEPGDQVAREASNPECLPELFRAVRNQDYVSKNFERWKQLAILTSSEQDPAKLTELATEMNLVLTQKTSYLELPLRKPSGRASLARKWSFDSRTDQRFPNSFLKGGT
jgi:hypothetical protein